MFDWFFSLLRGQPMMNLFTVFVLMRFQSLSYRDTAVMAPSAFFFTRHCNKTARGKCRYLCLKVKATGHCRGIKFRPHQEWQHDWQHWRLEGGSVAVLQSCFLAQQLRLCSVTFHFNSCVLSDPNQWMGIRFKMKSANIICSNSGWQFHVVTMEQSKHHI